jgi:hypothetical protein
MIWNERRKRFEIWNHYEHKFEPIPMWLGIIIEIISWTFAIAVTLGFVASIALIMWSFWGHVFK